MHDRNGGERSEAELIRRAAAGDHRAFENLIRRVDRRVLALAHRFTGSNEDAQDIYQEVFIRVFSGLDRFRGQSEFSTWVHRIAVNVCMTNIESRKKRTNTILPLTEGGGERPSGSQTPESQLLGTETRERVREALLELPARQRMVFALRHYEGYRLREIAIMMGCREGTVKRYLFEATRTMRDRLRDLVESAN
jgi:RNA polymerase sigma-70 factor (ECF subfamily)